MKKSLVLVLLIVAVLLAACGSGQSAATPTSAPAAPPTVAPTMVPTVARPQQPAIDTALLANDWHWIGLTDPTQQIAIEQPTDYVVSFQGDGTILVKADCNNTTANYKTDNGKISITVGPTTMAACPTGSRGDQFVKLLNSSANYFFKDGKLYIDTMADGGTLAFAPPDALPGSGQSNAATIDVALLQNDWYWIGLTDPTQQFAVEKPADYVLSFQGDGTVLIKADCNNATGTYKTDNGAISITVGPMTKAACPPGSRSDQFVKLLGGAARYFFKDGNLLIDLKADSGTMTFAPPSALSGDDSTAPAKESLQAQPWQWTSFTGATGQFNLTDPGSYMVTFAIDGSVSVKADCNNAAGTYTTNGGAITINIGPMTMAACPPGSHSDQFVKLLSGAARYHFLNGGLYIDLKADGGTLVFAPVK